MLYTYSMIYISLPAYNKRSRNASDLSSFVRFMVDVFFPSIVIVEHSNWLAYISKFTTSCQERLTAGRKEPNWSGGHVDVKNYLRLLFADVKRLRGAMQDFL